MVAAENFFEQPAFVKDGRLETFDCVFGVPHMGTIPSQQAEKLRNDRYGRFPDLLIDRFSRELVTLAHALKVLRPKLGRGAILLPQKFLSMMNTRKIRTYMVSMNYVDAIASMPSYLFPGLSVDLAMLVFRMNKQDKKVLFIDAETLCSQADKNIDQDKFLEIYFRRTDSENSMLVNNTNILGNDSSLHFLVYKQKDQKPTKNNYHDLEKQMRDISQVIAEVQTELDEKIKAAAELKITAPE